MTLNAETLRAHLGDRPYRYYDTVGSTNDLARTWLAEGAPAGACVIADEQTAGRGRQQRAWHTPSGQALAVSVILYPPADALAQMVMLGGLAVAETLDDLGLTEVGIKWPNDVLLRSAKVCGVLAEAAWQGAALQGVVLGIGLNVRVDFTGVPTRYPAISLETALGRRVERAELLARLLRRIDARAADLGTPALYHAWKTWLTMLGAPVTVAQDDGALTGIAEDVDADGVLLLRDPAGALHRVIAGDLVSAP